ncbi:MAG: MFS transporter [Proteobacteria bacterium]|jgi:DHA1 family multidrug/chloramphenicol efflux transport protein-like MFS transporter|nr:MFS transporter [Pseudomonadota bacterium]
MKNNLRLYLFALSLVIYEFTTYAANDMIMPGMLMVVKEFNSPVSYVALSLSMYLFGNALLQLFLGPLSERFSKRTVIIGGNILFLVFTVFIAASNNMDMFLLGRLLQGAGIAFVAMGYALIHENFDDKNSVRIIALMGNITVLAPIIGPFIGGAIIGYASWRYVFIFSLITGLISLYGLIKYTPPNKTPLQKLNLSEVMQHYYDIFIMPKFLVGVLAIGFLVMPSMLWIAISPTLVMHTLKLSMHHYMYYQAIAIGGFLLSTIINQIAAGKINMLKLISLGAYLSIVGFVVIAVFHTNILWIAIGFCISCTGLGLQLGTMFRILGKLEVKSQSLLFSLMAFIQIIIMAVVLESSNNILKYFDYSLLSFVVSCLVLGIISMLFVFRFISMNKNRNWQ